MLIFIVVSVSFMMFELNNAALYILLCALFMCIAIMAACYGYFKEQNEIMENAVAQITEYISGNRETSRTRKIMVMYSNERGECHPRTLIDHKRKR